MTEKTANTTKKHIALATAALLIAGCSSSNNEESVSDAHDMGQCFGVNSCKGTGSCAIQGKNACAGENLCSGKGWLPLSKKDCTARSGRFAGFTKKSS